MLSPNLVCLNYVYVLYNSSSDIVGNSSLTLFGSNLYNFTFSQPVGTYEIAYCTGAEIVSKEVIVGWEESSMMIIAAIILLPMLLSLIMLVGAATLGEKHSALRISLFLLSVVPFFASMHFGLVSLVEFIPGFTVMQELIGDTSYWVGIVFFILISYFILYMIYSLFTGMNEKKKEDLEY
jgi:hypothetical protein